MLSHFFFKRPEDHMKRYSKTPLNTQWQVRLLFRFNLKTIGTSTQLIRSRFQCLFKGWSDGAKKRTCSRAIWRKGRRERTRGGVQSFPSPYSHPLQNFPLLSLSTRSTNRLDSTQKWWRQICRKGSLIFLCSFILLNFDCLENKIKIENWKSENSFLQQIWIYQLFAIKSNDHKVHKELNPQHFEMRVRGEEFISPKKRMNLDYG